MIKRVRDKIRTFKPQQVISNEDWEDVQNRAKYAKLFLRKDNPMYVIITHDLKDAENMLLENRIHEVREIHHVTDTLQKLFITPRKEQMDEVVGQIKYLRGFIAELQSWIHREEELEKMDAAGVVSIIRSKEKLDG